MNTVIIYKTVNGATKKYAQILQKETGADLFDFNDFESIDISKYDRLIVSSGTYAGSMPLVKLMKKHWDKIKDKDLVAVAIGEAPADNWWSKISYRRIPKYIRASIKYCKIPGGDLSKFSDEDLNKNLHPARQLLQ